MLVVFLMICCDVWEVEDVRKARNVREIKDVGKGRERETVGSAEL